MDKNYFDNMIQVLTYFADSCDMFQPILDGVNDLWEENQNLKAEIEKLSSDAQINMIATMELFEIVTGSLTPEELAK